MMNVVIVNCFNPYEERAELVRSFFVRKGDSVNVITSNFLHIEKEYKETERPNYYYVDVKPYYKNISFKRAKSHIGFAKDATKVLETYTPDVVYALVPPNSLVKELVTYKKQHPDVKLIFDIIDLWPETMPMPYLKSNLLLKAWADRRDKYIKDADYVVTECDLYQKRLEDVLDADKTKTIYLARKSKKIKVEDCTKADQITLCYLGSINNVTDIAKIGRIIHTLAKEQKVELHFIGQGEKKEELLQNAKMSGAHVIDHGIVYNTERKQEIFNQCNYGINIMKPSVCVGLTMKSIDYFEGGLPIINNIADDTWHFVEHYGVGVNYKEGHPLILPPIEKAHVHDFYEKHFLESVFYERLEEVCKACLA